MASKKIIVRGPAISRSGYGVQCRTALRALRKFPNRFDVYLMNTIWGNTSWTWEDTEERRWIDGLIQKTALYQQQGGKYDLSLQVCIPNEFQKLAEKNIGYTAGIETDRISTQWFQGCFNVDKILFTSNHAKSAFVNAAFPARNNLTGQEFVAKLEMPMEVVPYPVNLVDPKPIDVNFEYDFNFLCVAQWGPRKNVENTIKWFLIDRENTSFRIREILNQFDNEKRVCRIHLLHGDLTDEEMTYLYRHPKIKCLISLSHGEGFCGLDYTPIITNYGRKRLDEIKEGDLVLTHKNRFRNVSKTMKRHYEGEMIKIIPYNSQNKEPIILTPNHNVYILDKNTNKLDWKKAGTLLKGDYVIIPKINWDTSINKIRIDNYITDKNCNFANDGYVYYNHSNGLGLKIKNEINLDKKFGRLIGWYLSEGSNSVEKGEIKFSLNSKEYETYGKEIITLMYDIFGIKNYNVYFFENKECVNICFCSKIVSNFLLNFCGHCAKNKFINEIIFQSCDEFKKSLISSLIEGDGWIGINLNNLNSRGINIQLVNKTLLRDIKLLLLTYGITCSYAFCIRKGLIKDKWKYESEVHKLRINRQDSVKKLLNIINEYSDFSSTEILVEKQIAKDNRIIENNDYFFLKIKNIEKINYKGFVYNLSVEEDETYCTENFIVHNCLPAFEAVYNGLPLISANWGGVNDFIYMPQKDKKSGKTRDNCSIANVHYDVNNVQPEAVWDGVILANSKWAFPREQSAKLRMKHMFSNYGTFKSQALKLQQHVLKEFEADKILTHFANCVEEYYPVLNINDFLFEEETNPMKEIVEYE